MDTTCRSCLIALLALLFAFTGYGQNQRVTSLTSTVALTNSGKHNQFASDANVKLGSGATGVMLTNTLAGATPLVAVRATDNADYASVLGMTFQAWTGSTRNFIADGSGNALGLSSGSTFGFSSTTDAAGTKDVGLVRGAAGRMIVNNGAGTEPDGNLDTGALRAFSSFSLLGAFAMPPTLITALAVNQQTNAYQMIVTNANFSVLFGGTPVDGARGQFDIKNTGATNIVVTWPISWSIAQQALITSFIASSNGITEVFWYFEGGSNRVRVASKEIVQNFLNPTAGQLVGWHDPNTQTNVNASAGGNTAWDDIADPDADSTIAFIGFQQTISSTLDGGTSLTITNTDADNAADTILLKLAFNDLADANSIFARFVDDADGTPVTSYQFGATAMTVGSAVAATFNGTLMIPSGTADVALGTVGQIHLNETDEQLGVHSGSNGEISGEAAISLIYTKSWSFDPDAVCDGAVDRLFLMWIQDEAPEGIIIDEWKISFEADPTTEIDADLKYADAMIGVANAVTVDALDTTAGTATEDTDANINGGSAIPNGKVLYIEFATAYTEANHQIMFQIWYHYEED